MSRPIAISLSPNSQKDDVFLALKLLFSPWVFFKSNYIKLVEQWFRHYFDVPFAISFNSGRGALLAILKALDIGEGDEVIIQSFTCVAVPNAVIAAGAKPIYVDITRYLTMSPSDLERKITEKTKAIIFQYTFGIPGDIDKIYGIAKKYKIDLIEDVAHTIGGVYKNKKLGLFGRASFFSFGRDKAFSSVFGSIVITNSKELGKKIRTFQRNLGEHSFLWVIQQLLHPILFSIILPVYNNLSLGKFLIIVFQKLKFLSLPISPDEKLGKYEIKLTKKLPNALACLAYNQVRKLEIYNNKRKEISSFYLEGLRNLNIEIPYCRVIPFLRFPIFIQKRDEVMQFFQKNEIYLGKWYSEVIDPKEVNPENIYYEKTYCPNALYYSKKIINLPTYPTMTISDAKKVIELLKKYA